MADLRKETHGPGSMKGVNLAVISYDNRVAKKDDVVTTHYLDARIHPGDTRAPGQTSLALVSKKDAKSPTGYNNSARYSAGQFEEIQKAAGDNVADLTNTAGEVVGKIYGVKADLLITSSKEMIANTKTLEASDFSVGDNEAGKDIRTQIFDSMKEAKNARTAAAAEAPEAVAAEAAPVEVAPAAKAKAARKPKAAKPELVSVAAEATQASSDEPELG